MRSRERVIQWEALLHQLEEPTAELWLVRRDDAGSG